MIFVDGNKIGEGNSEAEKYYRDKKKELLETYQWPIRIKDRLASRINETGYRETAKSYSIPLKQVVNDTIGSHEWRYSTGYPVRDNKTGRQRYPVMHHIFKGELVIDKSDIDLAFFIIFRSDILQSTKLYVVDTRKEAEVYASAKRKMAGLAFMLWEEESPIYNNDQGVRDIAASLGIPHAHDKNKYSLNEVKMRIESVVTEAERIGDTTANYEAFKKASKLPERVKQKALVQKAIDANIVKFDDLSWSFFILDNEGNQSKRLARIDTDSFDEKEEILIEYLMKNEDDRLAIEGRLGEEFFQKEDLTLEEINAMDRNELVEHCKRYRIKSVGVNEEFMREALMKRFNLVKQE